MKKYKAYIKTLVALVLTGAAMTACSDKDLMANEDQQSGSPTNHYTMTVNATIGDNGTKSSNRALYLDGEALKVKWADTDQVSVFKAKTTTQLGTLTAAASETGTTTLSGDLTGTVNEGDKLHLIFPRPEWDYTGQKGILLSDENSIEKKYDYAITDVTVAAIDESHITTTADANFASQQAIVKFILKNKDGDGDLNVKKLTVSAASNKLVTSKRLADIIYHTGYTVDKGSGGISGDDHTHLVDGNPNTKWCMDGGSWYIEFHTDAPVLVNGYMFRTARDTKEFPGRNPKSWVLKGKASSGASWTTIDSKSGNAEMPPLNDTEHNFTAAAPGTYQYFRLEISAVQEGDIMQLSEMKLFSQFAEATEITEYGPVTATLDAAGNEVKMALRNENDGADTYTLTAVVGDEVYALEKSGVTFENGKYYEITAKLTKQKIIDLSAVTEDKEIETGYTITGTLNNHKIALAAGAVVTLDNVTINNSNITCRGDAEITLVGTNKITAPETNAALRVGNAGTTLTILGSGSLEATGGGGAAGIGTGSAKNEGKTGGNIIIKGGTITARGSDYGAGIGCGATAADSDDASTQCGDITIKGGTVTATGGIYAAGIGTGSALISGGTARTICGNITITGGTVTAATAAELGATGIGTGAFFGSANSGSIVECGDITIVNTVTQVTATKGSSSNRSIGRAYDEYYECGTVTIGGTVKPDGISDSPYTYQP